MGASGWHYFTPYREIVADALEELRQRVFANKEYGDLFPRIAVPPEELAAMPAEQRRVMEDLLRQSEAAFESLKAMIPDLPEPQTIDELLEQRGENGTHSILDIMCGTSESADFGTAFPMPRDVMLDLYGTSRPTREQVEAKTMQRNDDLGRWECWYVTVYKDGEPSELYFEGCSGD